MDDIENGEDTEDLENISEEVKQLIEQAAQLGPNLPSLFDPEGRELYRRAMLSRKDHRTKANRSFFTRDGAVLGGRPYLKAHIPRMDIPGDAVQFEKTRLEYYKIINKLSYQEAMALCRALGYSRSTFKCRKYGHRKPTLEEVILVVYWYKCGKPMVYKKHKHVASLFDYYDHLNKRGNVNQC